MLCSAVDAKSLISALSGYSRFSFVIVPIIIDGKRMSGKHYIIYQVCSFFSKPE